MAKQPLKKKEVMHKSNLSAFKAKMGLGDKEDIKLETSNADKPLDWIIMPKAYQDALKLPGIPVSYVTTVIGHSNTGKSTLVNHAIVSAQRKGFIPVIYDTENNFDWTYAINMGMEAEPIYGDVEIETVDPETGEISTKIEKQIVRYDGNFIYFNNTILAELYGKMDYSTGKENKTTKRKVAVIEDIAASINDLLNAQDNGEIDSGFLFIWDSVGSIGSYKSYKSLIGNNMFDAGAISVAFNSIINDRIPRSRKQSSIYSNTLLLINKVWLDSMSSPVGPPSLSLKGGNSIYYGSRLIILTGGQLKSSTKRISAQSKGVNFNFALETKMKCIKNQLPAPYTVTYEGTVVCTPHGMISIDEIDKYKKDKIGTILSQLSEISKKNGKEETFTEDEVKFVVEETDEV